MKIGELFVALNFKVDGQGDLAKAYNDVQNLGKASGALALGIGAMSAGFIAMISSSATAGNALKNFQNVTGMSTDKLQQWQHYMKLATGSGDAVMGTVTQLSRKMSDVIRTGQFQGLTGWTVFGLDPSDDSFATLDKLNARFLSMSKDPKQKALFGSMLKDVLGGDTDAWIATFMRSWTGKGLSDNLIQNQKEIDNLDTMAVKIRTITSETEHAANSFSSLFVPAVDDLTTRIDALLQKVGKLSKELNNGTPESEKKKAVLNTGTEVVVGAGLGLGALATVTKVLRLLGVTGATTGSVIGSVGRLSPYLAWTAAFVDKGMDIGEVASGRGGRNFGEKFNTIIKPPFWDPLNRGADRFNKWAGIDWNPRPLGNFLKESLEALNRSPSMDRMIGSVGNTLHATVNINGYAPGEATAIGNKVVEKLNNLTYLQTTMAGAAPSR